MRPALFDMWGAAFNGQCFRQVMFMDLIQTCQFDAIVEAGTFRGSTTRFFARSAQIPVYSSEVNPRFHAYATRRLEKFGTVQLFLKDSRRFLRELQLDKDLRLFFYLDAHWSDDLPLREETEFIFKAFTNFVVMIDDFEVTNDPAYGFDDYGPGKRLSLSDFAFHQDARVRCYFPSRAGRAESGSQRGCIVLASTSLAERIDNLPTLAKIK
jgi:hypothetical protein